MLDGKKSTLPTFSVFYGAIINPISLKKCEKHPRALIFVNHHGNIVWMCDEVAPEDLSRTIEQKVAGFKAEDGGETGATFDVTILEDREFIIPGFVDTQTHAPQVPNMGSGGDFTLLKWLQCVTYPMEANFKHPDIARKAYPDAVRKFI